MRTQSNDKKQFILDSAEQIFADFGFDGGSTRMIANHAGVNPAMLQYYFSSKGGLFQSVFNRKMTEFREIVNSLNDVSTDPWTRLLDYIDKYFDKIESDMYFQKLIYQELGLKHRSELSEKLKKTVSQHIDAVMKTLQEGIDRGEFRNDADKEMVIATIYGSKNYVVNMPNISSVLLGFDTADPENLKTLIKPRIKEYLKKMLSSYLLNDYKSPFR